MIGKLSPKEVKELIASNGKIRLIDVRELWEYEIAKIDGAELLPLSNFVNLSSDLNKDERYVIYCHHGARSFSVCKYMEQNGFKDVINLEGGIDAWAREIDNSINIY